MKTLLRSHRFLHSSCYVLQVRTLCLFDSLRPSQQLFSYIATGLRDEQVLSKE